MFVCHVHAVFLSLEDKVNQEDALRLKDREENPDTVRTKEMFVSQPHERAATHLLSVYTYLCGSVL